MKWTKLLIFRFRELRRRVQRAHCAIRQTIHAVDAGEQRHARDRQVFPVRPRTAGRPHQFVPAASPWHAGFPIAIWRSGGASGRHPPALPARRRYYLDKVNSLGKGMWLAATRRVSLVPRMLPRLFLLDLIANQGEGSVDGMHEFSVGRGDE
jgi:hypothetical protein